MKLSYLSYLLRFPSSSLWSPSWVKILRNQERHYSSGEIQAKKLWYFVICTKYPRSSYKKEKSCLQVLTYFSWVLKGVTARGRVKGIRGKGSNMGKVPFWTMSSRIQGMWEGTVMRLGPGYKSFISNAESDLDSTGQLFSNYISNYTWSVWKSKSRFGGSIHLLINYLLSTYYLHVLYLALVRQ